MEDNYKLVEIETAPEFLNYLRPSNSHWIDRKWIFRGHSNENFELLPKILRNNGQTDSIDKRLYDYFDIKLRGGEKSERIQMERLRSEYPQHYHSLIHFNIEQHLISEFVFKCNEIGLELPDMEKALFFDSVIHRNGIGVYSVYGESMDLLMSKTNDEYDSHLRTPQQFVGIAQHHGISTRLLDFSFNPLKAIHFAISGSVADKICVWAVRTTIFLNDSWKYKRQTVSNSDYKGVLSKYSISLMPNTKNASLRHQQGLFLYPKFPFEHYIEFGKYPTIIDFFNFMNPDPGHHFPHLIKVTLPINEVTKLRELMKIEGITLSTLMPSYDNVIAEMKRDIPAVFKITADYNSHTYYYHFKSANEYDIILSGENNDYGKLHKSIKILQANATKGIAYEIIDELFSHSFRVKYDDEVIGKSKNYESFLDRDRAIEAVKMYAESALVEQF